MKRTIIYLRTSTEEQNPQNQLRDCKTLINGDYEVIEEKQSAFKDKDRFKFEAIKKQIKQGKVSEIICWDLDRLYRNRKKLIEFFKFCKYYNCKVNSFRQQWLNKFSEIPEPFNEIMFDMMLQIMGWLAEEESRKKSERVKIAFKNSTKKWGRKPLKNVDKRIKELHQQGKSVREIALLVHYWDSSRNKKFVSKSYVHKIIKRFKQLSS
jgi:DNA invertase Pin-like site-specific DNA recombinase